MLKYKQDPAHALIGQKPKIYQILCDNQINARTLIGQSAVVYCAGKPTAKWRISEFLYKSNRPQLSMGYLSNRPQVSVVYKLINHAGCWQNTRRICKPRAAGEWFTNSSSVLPTSQVVYQPITHTNLWFIIQKTCDFSLGLPAQ